jgi:perosamine synthetase
MINQIEPQFGDEEVEAGIEYLKKMKTGEVWLTEHQMTRKFEADIAKYLGVKHCSVVANGTVAITLALASAGIKKGDEILCPDYTFVASATAGEMLGAKITLVDIDRETLCIDFNKMKEAVSKKTKAVILVSMNGRYPKNIIDFVMFCKEKKILLVEDAAQSLGSKAYGKFLGTYGDIGCFSFSMPKIISTGQGGAVVTNNTKFYERMKRIRNFGRDGENSDHFVCKGWNFKFTDLQAVIGIEQLKKLDARVKRKKMIAALYRQLLSEVKYIELIPFSDETALCSVDMLVKDFSIERSGTSMERDLLIAYLKREGIGARPFYPPLHKEPYNKNGDFSVTNEVCDRGLWLPSSLSLTDDQIRFICSKIKEYYERQE